MVVNGNGNGSGGRERLAWGVLLVSFGIWLALVISVPLLGSRFVQTATRPLQVAVQANYGTVRWEGERRSAAIFGGDPAVIFNEPGLVLTNVTDAATVLIYTPDLTQLVARLQVYTNTAVDVLAANAPRFSLSSNNQRLEMDLQNGRLRVKVLEGESRPLEVTIHTPQGTVWFDRPGDYAVEVDNVAAQVVVLEGEAHLEREGAALVLGPAQRGVLGLTGAPTGPLSTERNLVRNGDFLNDLEGWEKLAWHVERDDQPVGKIEIVDTSGDTALRLHRVGEGHADSGVHQLINQDVTDYVALRLEISLRLLNQTLQVCGSVGSECPLTVEIWYTDINGNEQVWRQGFFASGTPGGQGTPAVCISCGPPRPEHEQIPAGQFAFYRGELLELLAQHGMAPPSRIKSIYLIAAGHSFDVEVLDVSLIGEE